MKTQPKRFLAGFGLFMMTVVASCDKLEDGNTTEGLEGLNLPTTSFEYDIPLPPHFMVNSFPPQMPFQFAASESDNTPNDNQITNAGATLGRVLFYEKKLSANGTISCASCHKQDKGFSDDEILSLGFDGGLTGRHSMGIVNARFYDTGKFFWDERAETLEDQVLMPLQDPVEMGMTLTEVVDVVEAQNYAAPLFTDAFGDETVTTERISKALAQFVRSISSFRAKYDEGRAQVMGPLDDFPNFTEEENLGKQSFFTPNGAPSCGSCHGSEAFVAPLLAPNATTSGTNNGLDANTSSDQGVGGITGVNGHNGKFKVPSLRNVALRAPYMHDGRFASLGAVIDHYSTGIQDHPNLQPFLRDQQGNPVQYNFTPEQKSALVAFLNTLTDDLLTNDPKFSDPFID
ncbi:MAG: cytochrome-c peroxidase [Flavobacteriales bacterium]